MAKPHSCFVILIVLLMPMVLSCSKRQAAKDSFNRGVDAFDEHDYDLAITCFTEVIRLNPEYAEAYYNRGLAYEKNGDQANAEADFTNAKELGYKPE